MMRVMDTLRLFAEVAHCHSFSQAASQHGITQSAASQRIGHLEKRLGVTLLDRSVRPLALTEAGKVFLEGCEDLLERNERLERRVARTGASPEGVVRVEAIYSSGIELLDQIREHFEAEHPRVSVQIRYNQPDEVYRAVQDLSCDLGILSYPRRWRGVGVLPLRDEVMAVVCRPTHPLARRRQVSAADLSPYEMVTFDVDLPVGRRIRHYLRDNSATPRIVNSFDNIDTIKGAVAVTERFSILPQRTVSREVETGVLALVALSPRLERSLGVIYRRRPRQASAFSPVAGMFVDYLLAHAGPDADLDSNLSRPKKERHLVGDNA